MDQCTISQYSTRRKPVRNRQIYVTKAAKCRG